MESCGVLVFSENKIWAEGLVDLARSIAGNLGEKVALLYVRPEEPGAVRPKVAGGADFVYQWVPGSYLRSPEALAAGLTSVCESLQVKIVLVAASPTGKEVASRTAAALNSACVTDCINVYVDQKDGLIAEKLLFGGAITAEIVLQGDIKICAVSTEVIGNPLDNATAVEVSDVTPDLSGLAGSEKEILEVRKVEKSVDLASAKKIVSIGRACRKQEDIEMIRELCGVLGAELGCSRPVAEELKWLPEERKVGLTGTSVKPEIYFAVGISGQVQHIAGMKDSRIVVVINNDKKAPFFNSADYGLVGDLYEIVPELIGALR